MVFFLSSPRLPLSFRRVKLQIQSNCFGFFFSYWYVGVRMSQVLLHLTKSDFANVSLALRQKAK